MSYWTQGHPNSMHYYGLTYTPVVARSNVYYFHYHDRRGCITGIASTEVHVREVPQAIIAPTCNSSLAVFPLNGNFAYLWSNGDISPTTAYNPEGENCCTVTDLTTGCQVYICYDESIECDSGVLVSEPRVDCDYITIQFIETIENGEVVISKDNWDTVCPLHNQSAFTWQANGIGTYSLKVNSRTVDSCVSQTISATVTIHPRVNAKTNCDGDFQIWNMTSCIDCDSGRSTIRVYHLPDMEQVELPDSVLIAGQSATIRGDQLSVGDSFLVQLIIGSCTCSVVRTHHQQTTMDDFDIVLLDKYCFDTPYLFGVSSTAAIMSYEWKFGDGVVDYGDSVYHSFPYVDPVSDDNPYRTITLVATDNEGCEFRFSKVIQTGTESFDFEVQSSENICPGQPIEITLIDENLSVGRYHWRELDTLIGAAIDGFTNCFVQNAGHYNVVAISRRFNCRQEEIVDARHQNVPKARIFSKDVFCEGEPVELFGFCGEGFDYHWSVTSGDDGQVEETSSSANATFAGLTEDTYRVQLTLSVPGTECGDTQEKTISVVSVDNPTILFCGSSCIHLGPVCVKEYMGRPLYWNNGEYGDVATYYRPGYVSAYYMDPVTQCKSPEVSLVIPHLPNMDAFLSGCYELCNPVDLYIPQLEASSSARYDILRNGRNYRSGIALPATINLNSSGSYQLRTTYGSGCGPINSDELSLNLDDCPNSCLSVITKVADFAYAGCKIVYKVLVDIVNLCEEDCLIESMELSPNIMFSTPTVFPLSVVGNGGHASITIELIYDIMPLEVAELKLLTSLGVYLLHEIDFSGWDSQIPNCGFRFQHLSGNHEPSLGMPRQTEYYNFRMTLPGAISNCLSVWIDEGTIVHEVWHSPFDVELLAMFDYGRLTQMARDEGCIRLHALVCQNDRLCIIDTCISAKRLVGAADWPPGEEFPFNRGGQKTVVTQTDDAALYLAPNPGSGSVRVMPRSDIKSIEVISMLGKRMLRAENVATFDVSALPVGAYIVAIEDGSNAVTYVKFIKK